MILQPTLLTLMCALRNTNNKFYHIQMTDRISVARELACHSQNCTIHSGSYSYIELWYRREEGNK